jgi:hypothetical protein
MAGLRDSPCSGGKSSTYGLFNVRKLLLLALSGSKTFQTNQTWLKNPGTHHGGVWEHQSEMGD